MIQINYLYVHALQIGEFPLHRNETGILNRNIITRIYQLAESGIIRMYINLMEGE